MRNITHPSLGPAALSTRYQLERDLGRQSAGQFFVAIDSQLGGRVTLFIPNIKEDPGLFVRRMQREINRCAPLKDTSYCTIREAGLDQQGQAFVAIERPLGTPLSALLREKRFSTQDALTIAIQICDLVHNAHQCNVIPVPLSPDNIIVNPQPGGRQKISIVDLGLQRAIYGDLAESEPPPEDHYSNMETSLFHTQNYQPPQVRWEGYRPDRRDDVFAVTAVLHALVFGVAPPPMTAHGPIDGTGWPSLPENDGHKLDRRLESCLQTVLLKGLAQAREDRFAHIKALQRAILGLRQLMSLSAPAFELLAATRGRLGRRGDAMDIASPQPALARAQEASRQIQAVLRTAQNDHGRADLTTLAAAQIYAAGYSPSAENRAALNPSTSEIYSKNRNLQDTAGRMPYMPPNSSTINYLREAQTAKMVSIASEDAAPSP